MKRLSYIFSLLMLALAFPVSAQLYYTGSMTGWATPGSSSTAQAQKNDNCYYFPVSANDMFKMSTVNAGWDYGFNGNAIAPKGMSTNFKITEEAVAAVKNSGDITAKDAGFVCVSLDFSWIQLCANVADFKIPSEGPVTPTGPQLYLVGTPNGWGIGDPILGTKTTEPAGWYVAVPGAAQFKVSSAHEGSDWDVFNSGARKPKTNGQKLAVTEEAQPTVIDGGDPNLVAPAAGYVWVSEDYAYIQFVTSLADIKLPTEVPPTPPTPTDGFFLVGNFTGDWNLDGIAMEKTDNGYTATVSDATAGVHYFCFADKAGNWNDINSARYGAGNSEIEISADTDYTINSNNSNCWIFTMEEGVTYTFTVNADKTSFVVTADGVVNPPVPEAPEALYIIGNTQGWNTASAVRMAKTNSTFSVEKMQIDAAEGGELGYFTFLTVAGTDWDATNAGDRFGSSTADELLTSGVAAPVKKYPANVSASSATSFAVAAPAKYNITVSFEDAANPTVTAVLDQWTAIETIAADNEAAVYFDLQGRRVLAPVAGSLYIVKRGAEVTKVLVK